MKEFFRRIFNTEFLPMTEVRKIKVALVMIFLFIITVATVPFSFVFDYPLPVKIAVLAALFAAYVFTIVMMRFGKYRLAMHITILYTLGATMFYAQGTGSFYAYLFFYISLTVLVFYQELAIYLVYGAIITGFGVLYVFLNRAGFVLISGGENGVLLFVIILVLFFLIFLVQIIYSEKLYTDLNYEWVKMNQIIEKYQDQSLYYLEELRKTKKGPLLYEDRNFQKVVGDLSVFLCEQFRDNGKDITNVLDLYIYIHERGLDKILSNEDLSVAMKKIAHRLDKYLINRRTDMMSMILNFQTYFRPTSEYRDHRYEYHIDDLARTHEEQVVAIALIYQYLATEITGFDKYDAMGKVMTHEEIAAVFTSLEALDFFQPEHIAFFKDNADLFEQFLHLDK